MVDVSLTNIDIDDRLVNRVMERCGLRTKREAVTWPSSGSPMSPEEALVMEGSGWSGELEAPGRFGGGVVNLLDTSGWAESLRGTASDVWPFGR